MLNLITAAQMREADAHTISHRSISSLKLMENAAVAFVKAFKKEVADRETKITILCGKGNNGGDGLAVARLLNAEKYVNIAVCVLDFNSSESKDFKQNFKRLSKVKVPVRKIVNPDQLQLDAQVVVDAILGSGLSRPLAGNLEAVAKKINETGVKVIAIDVPTGFPSEGPISDNYEGVRADLVISFQRPKLNFFFPESAIALHRAKTVAIGLDEHFIQQIASDWKLVTKQDIRQLLKERENFSHKGTYGHALLVAGNTNTMGAALLTAKACLYAGAGLTTLCLPAEGLVALNAALPEVMALPRETFTGLPQLSKYNAIAIGPGLGTGTDAEEFLAQLVNLQRTLLIDADGLTILGRRSDLLGCLAPGCIITPHLKEFDRMFGAHHSWWERLQTAKAEAGKRNLIIVLKNRYSFVCLPNREVHINPTGNPAMASGGMGDALTGIIASFLAQGYPSSIAATLGVYIHGKAGDELATTRAVVAAGQVAEQVPKTIKKVFAADRVR